MSANVLLIVCDTARADVWEPWGAPVGHTPVVADVASRGAAVARAMATSSWTLPSHASMFTGLLPRAAGLARAPGGNGRACPPVIESHADRWLPSVFQRSGYRTIGVSANAWISEPVGFGMGFDEFHDVHGTRTTRIQDPSWRARLSWDLEAVQARADDGAGEAFDRVRAAIGATKGKFFAFVNLVECHSPYLPPRPYNLLSPLQRLRAAEEARRHLTLDGIWRACAGRFDIPWNALARMRSGYDQSIRLLDDWIGRLLGWLEDENRLDDTIVVITSDHGENLGEGGLIGHSFSLDDRLIHVPFVALPGDVIAGRRTLSLAELPRLLADAAGLSDAPWNPGVDLPTSAPVAQVDRLLDPGDERLERVRREWGLGPEGFSGLTRPITASSDGRWKLVRDGDQELLYDLVGDPGEVAPALADGVTIADTDGEALGRLRSAIEEADQTDAEPVLAGATPAPGPLPEELEDRMRLLGYM